MVGRKQLDSIDGHIAAIPVPVLGSGEGDGESAGVDHGVSHACYVQWNQTFRLGSFTVAQRQTLAQTLHSVTLL